MSNVPRQVQQAADNAQRRQQELIDPPKSPGENPHEDGAGDPPAGDPPPANRGSEVEEQLRVTREALEKEQQRFRSLQGMFNQQQNESAAMREQLAAMNQKLSELSSAQKPADPPKPRGYTTTQDAEVFGQDTIEFVTRVATAVAQDVATMVVEQALAQQLAPVTQQVSTVAQQVHKTAAERFYDELTDAVPDWRTLNVDPTFMQWLMNVDPVSGMPLQVLLQDAHAQFHTARVAAIFNRYKEAAGIATPQAPAQQQRQPPRDERDAMVEPARRGGGSGAPAGANAGKKTYTRAEIGMFYRNVREGRISREEAAVTEQDIIKAQSEGRIVG